jgi:hypothetical protein
MELQKTHIRNYFAVTSYCGTIVYLVLNPNVANHDKVLTFGIMNLVLLLFMYFKDLIAKENELNRKRNERLLKPRLDFEEETNNASYSS